MHGFYTNLRISPVHKFTDGGAEKQTGRKKYGRGKESQNSLC